MNLSKKQLFLLGFLICSIFALCIGLTVWGVRKECKPASRYQTILKKIKEASAQNKLFFVSQDGRMVATFDMNSPDLAKIIALEFYMTPIATHDSKDSRDVKIFLDYPLDWFWETGQTAPLSGKFISPPLDIDFLFMNTAVLPFDLVFDNLSKDEYFKTNAQIKEFYGKNTINYNNPEFIVGSFLYYSDKHQGSEVMESPIRNMVSKSAITMDEIEYEIKYRYYPYYPKI